MNVVLVDRSSVVRNRLVRLLADLPCVDWIGLAPTAASARKLAADRTVDAFVVDLSLDDGSGVQFLRDLKACTPKPLVIVLSSDMSPTFRERCLEIADLCLDKATAPDALQDALAGATAGGTR